MSDKENIEELRRIASSLCMAQRQISETAAVLSQAWQDEAGNRFVQILMRDGENIGAGARFAQAAAELADEDENISEEA